MVALWEMLALGLRALNFSANVQLAEEEDQADGPGGAAGGMMTGSLVIGLVVGIALFFVLPLVLTSFTDGLVESDFTSNLIEGAVRMAVFVTYIALIGLMPAHPARVDVSRRRAQDDQYAGGRGGAERGQRASA